MYVEWIDFSLANVFVIRMVVQSDSSAIFVVYKVFVVVRK